MKKTIIAAAAFLSLLLSSCGGEPTVPVQGGEQSTEDITADVPAAVTTTTTAATEETSTTPPEPVYSDDCKADIRRFAISDENPFVSSPVEYAIDGEKGVLSLSISYDSYVDIYTLQNCILDISVTEGEYSAGEALNPDGTVDLTRLTELILTDSEGLHRKYDVVTERTVYSLPIVNIYLEDTGVNGIDRYEYTSMTFFVDASGAEEFSSTAPVSGRIRGRGHSTWQWEKKPYRIKLDEGVPVLGLDKDKDWILLANYSDKSFLRNTVAYSMGQLLDGLDWTPTQYPVDLFINGEYRGVYTIGEHMEADDGRVDIDRDSSSADTGYLLEAGGVSSAEVGTVYYFHSAMDLAVYIVIQSPKEDAVTEEQKAYIEDYLNKAEAAIVSGAGYEEYIDVDSFVDWIIIHEITYNLDSCFRRSCYMTKDKGGKLKMGPIWDFDLAFGNYDIDSPYYSDWVTVGYGSTYDEAYVTINWCNYLMNDPDFRSRLRERWFEVRDRLLEEAMRCIDDYSEKIYPSQEENFKLWQIWGEKAGLQSDRNLEYETYELQIQYLREFIEMRAEWIDRNV